MRRTYHFAEPYWRVRQNAVIMVWYMMIILAVLAILHSSKYDHIRYFFFMVVTLFIANVADQQLP